MASLVQPSLHTAKSGVVGRYALLNRGAPDTILFCPGAGGNCYMLSWFQYFAKEHTSIAFLIVDRWPRADASIKDSSVLDSLSEFTIDLLDSLNIGEVSIASHSAGVYQQLHLAQTYPIRVKKLFFIAVHIPADYLQSRMANMLLRVPNPIFDLVKIIDSKGIGWMNRLGMRESVRNPDRFYKIHLGSARNDADMDHIVLEGKSMTDARDIDYALTWQRIEGIDGSHLSSLFENCTMPVVWYTCKKDVLFGPEAVERIRANMKTTVTVQIIDETTHADIYRRKDVWLDILTAIEPRERV
jgi:pimeloyl-ACP methyl ester carboxylesterase